MNPEQLFLEPFSLLEHISCPVALIDDDLIVHFANPAFRRKMGELPARGELTAIIANVEAVRRSVDSASCISSTLPMRLEPLKGEDAMLGLISQVTFAGRTMFLIQGSQTDANRYYKLNREMEYMNSALSRERRIAQEHESTCRAIEAFVEVLVHDIRSPLATVVQGMELLPMEIESNNLELCRKMMGQLKLSSMRLVDFVDSLYAHSKVHSTKLNLESVDLAKVVENLRLDLWTLFDDVDGDLIVKPVLPIIKADRNLLRQLLQNLLQNSVKFRAKDRRLQVVIGCDRLSDSHLELYVQDNGQGFPTEMSRRLFEPYLRDDKNRDGLGIGLATCKSIADKHSWDIRAEGAPDRGARFTVRIASWC